MILLQRLSLICAFLLASLQSFSQLIETKGKEFYFVLPYATDFNLDLVNASIIICSDRPVSGLLSTYKPFAQVFSIPPDSCIVIPVNHTQLVPYAGDSATHKIRVKISTTDSVTVYCSIYGAGANDGSLILPSQSLGIEYQMNYFVSKSLTDSYCIITSEKDNDIRVNYINNPSQTIFPSDSDESYVLHNIITTIGKVNSEADPPVPFTLFTGGKQPIGNCNGSECCYDLLFEQNLPDHFLGKKYISLPFKYGGGEITKIVALRNNTCISINNGPVTTINAGNFIDTLIPGPLYIQASQEISVSQFLRSNACSDFALGDPEYINVLPLTHFIKRTVFNTPDGYFPKFLVNILTKTQDVAFVTLDGENIRNQFNIVPSNERYSYAQIEIKAGIHILQSNAGLLATVYGLSGGSSSPNSSAFFLGGHDIYSEPFHSPAVEFNDDTVICYGEELLLKGIDRNANYLWQDGSTAMDYTVTAPGRYFVEVTNSCLEETYRDTIDVAFSSCGCIVAIPDIFSPNNDKINDKLEAYSDCFFLNEYHLRVYDRYGFLIFESKDPLESWDGRFKNIEVPDGIYIYDLSYNDGDLSFNKQGTIAVIK